MNNLHLLSDHVYDWSADSIRKIIVGVTKASAIAAAQTSAVGRGAARFADRAVQTLRQARMQMCRRSRPRAKVLPVGELFRRATADGLRATGKCGRHSRAR